MNRSITGFYFRSFIEDTPGLEGHVRMTFVLALGQKMAVRREDLYHKSEIVHAIL